MPSTPTMSCKQRPVRQAGHPLQSGASADAPRPQQPPKTLKQLKAAQHLGVLGQGLVQHAELLEGSALQAALFLGSQNPCSRHQSWVCRRVPALSRVQSGKVASCPCTGRLMVGTATGTRTVPPDTQPAFQELQEDGGRSRDSISRRRRYVQLQAGGLSSCRQRASRPAPIQHTEYSHTRLSMQHVQSRCKMRLPPAHQHAACWGPPLLTPGG